MTKYKVLKYFTWGNLELDKGQYILIEDLAENDGGIPSSVVSVEHYPEKNQTIGTKTIAGMVLLQRIKVV